jgi:hypothetical protein
MLFAIQPTFSVSVKYKGESVNSSQMDVKRKTCDIQNWKEKKIYLNISFTNTDTPVPKLYQ